VFGHIRFVRLPGRSLDDVARQRHAVIRVGHHRTGFEQPQRQRVFHIALQARRVLGPRQQDVFIDILKTSGVGEQVPQRNWGRERRGDAEVQVVIDVAIQLQLPRFDELHHRGRRERFGNRARAKQRRARVDGHTARRVGNTVSFEQQHVAVLHHRDDGSSNVAPLQGIRNEAVEITLEVRLRQGDLGHRTPRQHEPGKHD
jgi:hypothetical protein